MIIRVSIYEEQRLKYEQSRGGSNDHGETDWEVAESFNLNQTKATLTWNVV
jgi:hypothetical protein